MPRSPSSWIVCAKSLGSQNETGLLYRAAVFASSRGARLAIGNQAEYAPHLCRSSRVGFATTRREPVGGPWSKPSHAWWAATRAATPGATQSHFVATAYGTFDFATAGRFLPDQMNGSAWSSHPDVNQKNANRKETPTPVVIIDSNLRIPNRFRLRLELASTRCRRAFAKRHESAATRIAITIDRPLR